MPTRRAFLKAGGLGVVALGVSGSPLFLNHAAAAPTPYRRRKVLVTLFQRGAMDGLMAVSPFVDPHLHHLRPHLAMTAARSAGDDALIDLDGRFGLHPALKPLAPFYREGRLAIVHGVGSPDTTRSHFDAQDYMESGTPGHKDTTTGWLNRAVRLTGHDATPLQAVALAQALPRALYGPAPTFALADLDRFSVAKSGTMSTGPVEAMQMLERLRRQPYRPHRGARYPNTPLGTSLKHIARLIKADVGLKVAFAESSGWDTHARQGTTQGAFARPADDLARAVAAFWTDLDARQDDVLLMTMTEFGRTVAENASGGTDHGRAACLFVLGNTVDGGRIHGTVPALADNGFEDCRGLPVTTDFRSVFAEVAGTHLGITRDDALFPGWQGPRLPLMKQGNPHP